jgi:hypothetical protein
VYDFNYHNCPEHTLHKRAFNLLLRTKLHKDASINWRAVEKSVGGELFGFGERELRSGAKCAPCALFTKASPFPFGGSTPYSELFFVVQRILEALCTYVATRAHCARGFGRPAALGKEDLGIDLRTTRVRLPIEWLQKLRRDPLHPRAFL